jgi:hypothetical protein
MLTGVPRCRQNNAVQTCLSFLRPRQEHPCRRDHSYQAHRYKSAAATKRAEAEADRAMVWLKQAVAAGYNDIAHMQNDRDLDALRHARAD